MAVYTEVPLAAAQALMDGLALGRLSEFSGIRSGIENTNYFASTPRGQWVVTVFERLAAEELPYYLGLMQHLAERGLPVPAPQADAGGQVLHRLAGKPSAVVTRLPGSPRLAPAPAHCAQLGAMLARLHLAAAGFSLSQAHPRGLPWWQDTLPVVLPHVSPALQSLLQAELAFQQDVAASAAGQSLPRGPIHADLFRDNAMFDDTGGDDRLCGVFDFYFAGTDTWLFDLAVCLNDWCVDPATGALDDARAQALLRAYAAVRPLTPAEQALLPASLRAAALRFLISRLWDWHLPRPAALLHPKDPAHFERLLRLRIAQPWVFNP
jgi:homoserine kinase type II